ncbi:DUF3160 domain-containing protein [Pelotomaculum propionicicum]|uniref:DUF3160 domain-containing protein n=1 Tax=Pelotomaculum propionicicum TaxID=258475 RepID=UPI003B7A942B
MLLLLGAICGCSSQSGPGGKKAAEQVSQPAGVAMAFSFAEYVEVPVNAAPAVKPYQVDPGLGNITNKDMFTLSPSAAELLIKNGFVVVPNRYEKEFFSLYERNRYEPVPLFITTDSVLHNYHLFFDHLLRVVESEKLAPELKELNKVMLAQSLKQYEAVKGTDWENAARRNAGFFAVAGKLMDPDISVPPVVKDVVEKELALIDNHQGIAVSPLMNTAGSDDPVNALKEDYSQYIPRGHYERTELLQNYFKSMMWYGRMTFRLKNEDETRSAALITLALNSGENRQIWDRIYATTNFFVGKSDDISYDQFKELVEKIYGAGAGLQTVAASPEKWHEFSEAAGELEPPAIISMPAIYATSPAEREREIKGFRFMGQRFTIDAAVFQRLLYPEVKENSRGETRVLPRGMDIPAAMGSTEAYKIAQSLGDTDYRNYPENMAKMKEYITGLDKETWNQNLYWNWLYTLMPLIQEKPEGYPSFMRNAAWARKELNTYLGSWAELKHDTILYAKPVYAEAGGGGGNIDDRGYVEPNPYLYARLASLVKMTGDGLQARGLLNERDKESLGRMETLILALKTISEKELSNTPLTDEEYDLIRSYGGQLEHFWLEALRDEGIDHRSAIFDRPAALVGDVANNPSGGQVLEEATGNIFEIYAVVPVDGKLRIALGGVYSYYEFPWPLDDKLTDTRWHRMLNDGQVPPLPLWTESFIAQ